MPCFAQSVHALAAIVVQLQLFVGLQLSHLVAEAGFTSSQMHARLICVTGKPSLANSVGTAVKVLSKPALPKPIIPPVNVFKFVP